VIAHVGRADKIGRCKMTPTTIASVPVQNDFGRWKRMPRTF
jgi:hypothetical protein